MELCFPRKVRGDHCRQTSGRATTGYCSGAIDYLHTDHLGTPQFATGSDQSLTWKAAYQPFGAASTSGTITQNLRLPGQYFNLETGWNHNGFRDYVPELGRYLQPDPLRRFGSGNNLYAYVFDNPINLNDPFGLSGTLTIYSYGIYGQPSDDSGLGFHSWVSFTPDGGPTTTFGTWGNGVNGTNLGLNFNAEVGFPYTADRSAYLNDSQQTALMALIKFYWDMGSKGWTMGHPCSTFASDAWYAGTDEFLNPYNKLGISNPATLTNSIANANSLPKWLQWLVTARPLY